MTFRSHLGTSLSPKREPVRVLLALLSSPPSAPRRRLGNPAVPLMPSLQAMREQGRRHDGVLPGRQYRLPNDVRKRARVLNRPLRCFLHGDDRCAGQGLHCVRRRDRVRSGRDSFWNRLAGHVVSDQHGRQLREVQACVKGVGWVGGIVLIVLHVPAAGGVWPSVSSITLAILWSLAVLHAQCPFSHRN